MQLILQPFCLIYVPGFNFHGLEGKPKRPCQWALVHQWFEGFYQLGELPLIHYASALQRIQGPSYERTSTQH